MRRAIHDVTRVAFGVLAAVAITYQLARLQHHSSFRGAGNFFSFFTIQSNILAASMLVLAAVVRRPERSRAFEAARGAATFAIAITGIVFALLLSGLQERLDTHNEFVNTVVHYVVPVAAVVDWLLEPPMIRLGLGVTAAWLVYPGAWFAYTLIRGSVVHWYPYPFVDVSRHGYGGVLLRGAAFLAAFALVAAVTARVRLPGQTVAVRRRAADADV